MNTFAVLSADEILEEEVSEAKCIKLLEGVSFDALVRFASTLCHHLSYADEMRVSATEFQRFHSWFVREFVSEPLRNQILDKVACSESYRGKAWAIADQHRVANLVAAYVRANPMPVSGQASEEDMARLTKAQLMVNDLVSQSVDSESGNIPAAELLKIFAMSRNWDVRSHLPRMYDVYGSRLDERIPELRQSIISARGIDQGDFATLLFALYSNLLAALDPDGPDLPIPRPPWSGGLVEFPVLDPGKPEDKALRYALDAISVDWSKLRKKLQKQRLSNASILPLLQSPVICLPGGKYWAFDPGLILSAGSNGLFWDAVDAHEAAGGNRSVLFSTAGLVFEDSVADFLKSVGCIDAIRGDDEGEGLPDLLVVETDTLIAIEAKAGLMRDDVKWSADPQKIQANLEKITGNNQIMTAIGRAVHEHPKIMPGISRVIPVIVVLDPCFASPGLEEVVNRFLVKPDLECSIEDPHLLYVGELESAGNYIREGKLSSLLDARREVISNNGWVSVSQLISQNQEAVQGHVGRHLPVHDAQVAARARLNGEMKRFSERYQPGPPDG